MSFVNEVVSTARTAADALAQVKTKQKNEALLIMADALDQQRKHIIAANHEDREQAKNSKDLPESAVKRLAFEDDNIDLRITALKDIAELPDPVGQPVEAWRTLNNLDVRKVRVPLGVILMIYESRPHVTVNAGAFCLKSGNACILRGGSEVAQTNAKLAELWQASLERAGCPAKAVQVIQSTHEQVGELLTCENEIALVIPRGSKKMVRSIAEQSRVPLLKHEDGICHTYIDAPAPIDKAIAIAIDGKCLLPQVCNATETLLIHKDHAEHLPEVARRFAKRDVELRVCERCAEYLPDHPRASEEDWTTEYLDLILSVRLVDDVDQAIEHINHFGSGHTDTIVTDSLPNANAFTQRVDSAMVLKNASTMFDDGQSLGMGAEVGISTHRLHARGPIGLKDLTITKYVVEGQHHIMAPDNS